MAIPSTSFFLPVMFQGTLNKTIQSKMVEVPFSIVYKVNQPTWNERWEEFTLNWISPWNVEVGTELTGMIADLPQSNYQTLQGCTHQLWPYFHGRLVPGEPVSK